MARAASGHEECRGQGQSSPVAHHSPVTAMGIGPVGRLRRYY